MSDSISLCPVYPNPHWTRNSRTFQRGLQRGLQRIVRGSYSNVRDAIASRYQANSIAKGCKHSGMGAMPGERFTRSLRYVASSTAVPHVSPSTLGGSSLSTSSTTSTPHHYDVIRGGQTSCRRALHCLHTPSCGGKGEV